MSLKFSTHLRNKLLGAVPAVGGSSIAGTGIAAVTSTTDSFTVASGFTAAGFAIGDTIMVSGFLAALNNGIFTVATVSDTTIVIVETTVTGEIAGPNVKIQVIKGGSLKDIFKDGVLKIYSGTQPSSPDSSIGGATPLVSITVSSGTFTPGSPTAGLEFGAASAGKIAKSSAVWSGTVDSSGTAGWFRFYANATDAGGADTTPFLYPRIDGSVGTSGRELNMSSTSLTAAATMTIDTFEITLPEA